MDGLGAIVLGSVQSVGQGLLESDKNVDLFKIAEKVRPDKSPSPIRAPPPLTPSLRGKTRRPEGLSGAKNPCRADGLGGAVDG